MDYAAAAEFANTLLKTGLPSSLSYHNLAHTRDVVLPAAERLSYGYDLSGEEHQVLLTAVWFHDTGFIHRYDDNEKIGAQIAADNLPTFGYSNDQIKMVKRLIGATKLSHQPTDLLESIIIDADMDMLGRPDFMSSADQLRQEERIWKNRVYTDREWYLYEMKFLANHRYFTTFQSRFRNSGKVQNYLDLIRRMVELKRQDYESVRRQYSSIDTQPFRPI